MIKETAKINKSLSGNAQPPPSSPANNGINFKNKILRSLPEEEWKTLQPHLQTLSLEHSDVLHEPAVPIKSVYFVNEGVVSVLSVLSDGKSVEVGLIGNEGFVGLPLTAGFKTSSTRAVVQIPGNGFKMPAEAFKAAYVRCPELRKSIDRFTQILGMQASQIAACNRVHEMEERLARWLLMCEDRIGSNTLNLTQEFLANMLGSRRSTVTIAAGMLQRAGLINYRRGEVTILDRKALQKSACECYSAINTQLRNWEEEVRENVR